jgi:hypothetical protein
MKILNLSAIAIFSLFPNITMLAPAQADEISLICSTKQTTTTISLNSGASVPFSNWSVSDAIDVAYAVKKHCQEKGVQVNTAPALKDKINVTSVSSAQPLTIGKKITTAAAPVAVTVTSVPSQSGSLW